MPPWLEDTGGSSGRGRILFREGFLEVAFELDLKRWSEISEKAEQWSIPNRRDKCSDLEGLGVCERLGTVLLGWRGGHGKRQLSLEKPAQIMPKKDNLPPAGSGKPVMALKEGSEVI